jgi:hypothetical protein
MAVAGIKREFTGRCLKRVDCRIHKRVKWQWQVSEESSLAGIIREFTGRYHKTVHWQVS